MTGSPAGAAPGGSENRRPAYPPRAGVSLAGRVASGHLRLRGRGHTPLGA